MFIFAFGFMGLIFGASVGNHLDSLWGVARAQEAELIAQSARHRKLESIYLREQRAKLDEQRKDVAVVVEKPAEPSKEPA